MNKNLLKRIASVATELDVKGFTREAKFLDMILLKLAQEEMEGFNMDDNGDDEYAKAYFQKYPNAPRTYEEAYFQKYPNAPRTYEEAYFQKYPDAPRTYEEAFKRKKDNVNTSPAKPQPKDDFQSDESARQLAIKMLEDKIPGLSTMPRKIQDMMMEAYALEQGE